MNIPALRQVRRGASAGGITCIPTIVSEAGSSWLDCVQSGENYEVEYRLRGKDGDYRWFRARAVPIRDQGKDRPMVRYLFRYSRQQTAGTIDS
jgi:PAS domain-containing protein